MLDSIEVDSGLLAHCSRGLEGSNQLLLVSPIEGSQTSLGNWLELRPGGSVRVVGCRNRWHVQVGWEGRCLKTSWGWKVNATQRSGGWEVSRVRIKAGGSYSRGLLGCKWEIGLLWLFLARTGSLEWLGRAVKAAVVAHLKQTRLSASTQSRLGDNVLEKCWQCPI